MTCYDISESQSVDDNKRDKKRKPPHHLPQGYGGPNTYVRFGYNQQKQLYQNLRQVSRSINTDLINTKTQVKNQQRKS